MKSFQGRSVGRPKASSLKKFPQRQARPRDVQVPAHGQPPPPRVAASDQDAAQHAAVDGEAPFPDRPDLARELRVVVEVERDVVEPRAHEPAPEAAWGGGGGPLPPRRAPRGASHSPSAMAVAMRMPYQRSVSGPIWTAIAPGEWNVIGKLGLPARRDGS